MAIPLDGWGGGIQVTTSPRSVEVCSAMHGLFRVCPVWEGGGGKGEASDLGPEVIVAT